MFRLARFHQRHRGNSGRAFGDFTIPKAEHHVGFVVGSDFTDPSLGVFSLADMSGEVCGDLGSLCFQQPVKAVDYMRANGAQRASALLLIRPPVPWAIGTGA